MNIPDQIDLNNEPAEQEQQDQRMFQPSAGLMGNTPDQVELIREYLDDQVPVSEQSKRINQNFWALFSPNAKLAFLDAKMHPQLMYLYVRGLELSHMMSQSEDEYSWEDDLFLQNSKLNFDISITRSIGTNSSIINERTAPHQQQVRQQIQQSTLSRPKTGILSKTIGRLF